MTSGQKLRKMRLELKREHFRSSTIGCLLLIRFSFGKDSSFFRLPFCNEHTKAIEMVRK